jgi:mRNA interferase RelE/StbE
VKWCIRVHPGAVRELGKVPLPARQEIVRAIDSLSDEPRPSGAEKLSGVDALRLRCGDYRIIYCVRPAESLVLILKVGDRRDVYRHLDTIRSRLKR